MLDKHTRTVPVIDGGVFVGVLSRRDVLRCVARRELTSAAAAARGMDRPHSERPASTPPEPGSLNKPRNLLMDLDKPASAARARRWGSDPCEVP
jgi:CBS domain-containing protein